MKRVRTRPRGNCSIQSVIPSQNDGQFKHAQAAGRLIINGKLFQHNSVDRRLLPVRFPDGFLRTIRSGPGSSRFISYRSLDTQAEWDFGSFWL
ncbi:hypothetical protein GWI33_019035 [Rhynchophorus ferrugineus]|uniref:Uncharacterized protein n=1 Tax=Rhynchophorus ferrugineus TaxID=354439 RepID=A0A834HUP6_RHYFE|nr:hypothetical protein GWI33_019035 [Rhynchophorus ferrugineus]